MEIAPRSAAEPLTSGLDLIMLIMRRAEEAE